MAAQGHFEGQSVNRPLFDGEDYTYWKTRMEFFLQGLDYQNWSIIEEGDLLVTNEKDKWTEDDKKKISRNYKAKSILCCALNKKEFNRISACKSVIEMWEKLRITSEEESEDEVSNESSEDEEALLSRRLHRILAKKRYKSRRRQLKKGKNFRKPEGKAFKKTEPICYECKKPGHIKAECLKLKKTEFRKKDSSKKLRKYKKKAMAAAWDNNSDSDSESSSSEEEEEKANMAFMANIEEKFKEGVLTSPSESDEEGTNVDHVEPVARASEKDKGVAPEIPLLTRKQHRRLKQKKFKINMKPLIDRLDEQGKILCSMQSDIASIFISQSTAAKQVGVLTSELQSLKGELGSIKQVVQDLSIFVRAHLHIQAPLAPTPASNSGPSQVEEDVRPSGPKVVEEVVRPSGPIEAEQSGPPGPILDEFGPSGPMESEAVLDRVEDQVVAPEPPSSSPLPTPAPPSPPSSSTTSPVPTTFKQPLPRNISSATPFPSESSSSPASSTSIPPPIVEVPPASSSAGISSSGLSSSEPSIPPPSTSHSFLNPPTPPSFITIIPEGAQLEHHLIQDIKDEFEVAMLRSVLDEYGSFIKAQRQLHIKRMAPIMGPSYSIVYGAFQSYFEEQERLANHNPPSLSFVSRLLSSYTFQGSM
ncbi:hypothetical protein Taro_045983 [Colocasia esculenta]|uniref:CCHC-type domain-containing protein n=1 Tax=Colocasia esculenta TaxID=4460 RepID=A0A843WR10_COLES|nr:hypothetical protein [Colocasia esculenta]